MFWLSKHITPQIQVLNLLLSFKNKYVFFQTKYSYALDGGKHSSIKLYCLIAKKKVFSRENKTLYFSILQMFLWKALCVV